MTEYQENHESKASVLMEGTECIVCGKLFLYTPEYCCNGRDCPCRGQAINEAVCSDCCDRSEGE